MPSVSEKQRRFMAAAANNADFARKAGIDRSVAREFHSEDIKGYSAGGVAEAFFPAGNFGYSEGKTDNAAAYSGQRPPQFDFKGDPFMGNWFSPLSDLGTRGPDMDPRTFLSTYGRPLDDYMQTAERQIGRPPPSIGMGTGIGDDMRHPGDKHGTPNPVATMPLTAPTPEGPPDYPAPSVFAPTPNVPTPYVGLSDNGGGGGGGAARGGQIKPRFAEGGSTSRLEEYLKQKEEFDLSQKNVPQWIREMTHGPMEPKEKVKLHSPLMNRDFDLGDYPVTMAGGVKGLAETAYALKTLPFYFSPFTAPAAMMSDVMEAADEESPMGLALSSLPLWQTAIKPILGALRRAAPKAGVGALSSGVLGTSTAGEPD